MENNNTPTGGNGELNENAAENKNAEYEENAIPLEVSDLETDGVYDIDGGDNGDNAEDSENNTDDSENNAKDGENNAENGGDNTEDGDDFAITGGETGSAGEPDDDFLDAPSEGGEETGESKEKRPMPKVFKIGLIVIIVIAAIAAIMYAWAIFTVPKTTIMRNLYIEDINVDGKTYDEAAELISASELLNDQTITITYGESVFTINGSEIGITPDLETTVKNAFNYGKNSNAFANGFLNLKSLFVKTEIIPVGDIEPDLLIEKINEFGIELHGEMANHYIEINTEDTTATIWPGHSGYNQYDENSYSAAEQTIIEHLNNSSYYNIPVDLPISAPEDLTLEAFDAAVYTDPIDAYFAVENNEVTIVPEQTGRYIDKDEAAALLPQVQEGGEVIKIPYYISYAAITSEELQSKLFSSTLASYSTSYGGSTSNRKANVARAAELINGTVIASGEIFSFNNTVGDRTVSNGFYTATEYINGESVEGIGGGTCQVSTTLYSAVLYADLGVVSRTNHDTTVGYVPLGQDATVAYGSIDFKFKNTTDYPIKIKTSADGSTLTISIVGTAWDPERTVEIKHSTSMNGSDTVVYSTRYVYENGVLISTDPLGQSYYKPHG